VTRPASLGVWCGAALLTFVVAAAAHSVADRGEAVRTPVDRAAALNADVAAAPAADRAGPGLDVVGVPALRRPPRRARHRPRRVARPAPAPAATPSPLRVLATPAPAPPVTTPPRVTAPARPPAAPAPTPAQSFDSSG
jgi:hypothetical protein